MTPTREVTTALEIASGWLERANLADWVRTRTADLGLVGDVDVVAVGKAAPEMATGATLALGARVTRCFVLSDASGAALAPPGALVATGEHPRPGLASVAAAHQLVDFLATPTSASTTLLLISGGASSLCALPQSPVDLADLGAIFDASMRSGSDITTLNRVRASVSAIAGGALLRHVRTARSVSLILVDNVVSGAPWVGSGLTYDYTPSTDELTALLDAVGLDERRRERVCAARDARARVMEGPTHTRHTNLVLAEPVVMLEAASSDARERGYRVVSLGAQIRGDVEDEVARFAEVLRLAAQRREPVCVLGVGEVAVRTDGSGAGGRCQHFAWSMIEIAASLHAAGREVVAVARASDGRDFLDGVGGAWCDASSAARAAAAGLSVSDVGRRRDTNGALARLGQIIEGSHTGWNLCDLYVVTLAAGPPVNWEPPNTPGASGRW